MVDFAKLVEVSRRNKKNAAPVVDLKPLIDVPRHELFRLGCGCVLQQTATLRPGIHGYVKARLHKRCKQYKPPINPADVPLGGCDLQGHSRFWIHGAWHHRMWTGTSVRHDEFLSILDNSFGS
jgi:hypothetical protein